MGGDVHMRRSAFDKLNATRLRMSLERSQGRTRQLPVRVPAPTSFRRKPQTNLWSHHFRFEMVRFTGLRQHGLHAGGIASIRGPCKACSCAVMGGMNLWSGYRFRVSRATIRRSTGCYRYERCTWLWTEMVVGIVSRIGSSRRGKYQGLESGDCDTRCTTQCWAFAPAGSDVSDGRVRVRPRTRDGTARQHSGRQFSNCHFSACRF